MFDAYGKSYVDTPRYIFYDRTNPKASTIVHERTHVLRPRLEDEETYRKYRYFGNPMENAVKRIKQEGATYKPFKGTWDTSNLYNLQGIENAKDYFQYYVSPEEIVSRLNEVRFNQNLNPKHTITKEDLKEIREKASDSDRKGFLDLFTDDALLRLFNEVAVNDTTQDIHKQQLGNISKYGGNLFKSGGDKEKVRTLINDWVAANPTYLNMNTADFADWLYETAGLESTWGKNMVGKKSDGSNSGYNGYFGLKIDANAPFDAQIKAAYKKINQILTDQMTDYDIEVANKMGISQAQLLHKYWNQANRVTNYLHNGIDTTDGAGTHISDYGNNDRLIMDYSSLVRPAITDSTYTVKKGDTFSRIQSAVRVPNRNYNSAGDDLIRLQGKDFDSTKLQIGQTLRLIERQKNQEPQFIDKGRPVRSPYYTHLNNKDERAFQEWYFNVAKANGLSLNPNDIEHAYDYRGYWKNATPEELERAQQPEWHGTDTYKWPTHKTFSVESKYYNPKTMNGVGYWQDENTFVPGSYNALMKATEPNIEQFLQMIENNRKKSDGGSIHIKPSRKGTFTAAATKHGMGVQEFASKVLANKDNYSPKMVKKAAFAKAASGWKHKHGGIKF